MYSNEDLEFLRREYMGQDYPEGLNDHVLSCIASSSLNLDSKKTPKKNNNYMKFALVACLFIAIFSIFQNIGSDNVSIEIDQNKFANTRGIAPINNNYTYTIFENDFIVSIYPSDNEITVEDKIYNIDKATGKLIELKDILLDDINFVEIEKGLRDILEDNSSKFYIDFDGSYVIVSNSSLIVVDDALQNKIFKKEYILRRSQ